MKVTFSPRARRELERILNDLLSRTSPRTAGRVVDRLEARCMTLSGLSERGSPYAHPRLRHLRRIVERPYVIVYEIQPRGVEIVSVMHGSRRITAALMGETDTD